MPLLQRAASFAAVLLMLAGLAGWSTPGVAAGRSVTVAAPTTDSDAAVAAALPAFASLGAAIAAQEVAEIDEATRCLASAIYFESKGEPVDGQLAVAEVILNRAKSGRFPADVCGVVTQRGQFGFVRGGVIPAVDAGRRDYRTALAVAKVAMADAWHSSAPHALYFHGRREPIAGRVVRVASIGNHIFYR